jgi:hypothetical protein
MATSNRGTARDRADDEWELEPIDPDIALITDFLTNALSWEEHVAVDRRLDQDREFWAKVYPCIYIWGLNLESEADALLPRTKASRRGGVGFRQQSYRDVALEMGLEQEDVRLEVIRVMQHLRESIIRNVKEGGRPIGSVPTNPE